MKASKINVKINSAITDLALVIDKHKFIFDAKVDEYYNKGKTFQTSLEGKKLEHELRALVAKMQNISDEIDQLGRSQLRISTLLNEAQ